MADIPEGATTAMLDPDEPIDTYMDLLEQKHASSTIGGRCDEYSLEYAEDSGHDRIRLYCDSCGIVLDGVSRSG